MKLRFDLKHALVARARAEDKEKEARKDVKVAEDELRVGLVTSRAEPSFEHFELGLLIYE